MNPYFYMLEKEWLEHKVITRIPLVLLVCGVVLLLSILMNSTIQSNVTYELTYDVNGFESGYELGKQLSGLAFGFTGFLSILLTSLYFPKTLRKERQEGSVMFWRSMPVSDMTTHIVKLGFGLLVTPIICSMLVVSADFLMWVINLVMSEKFPLFFTGESIFYVFTHWFEFIGRMWLVGLALLPLATLAMAISQKVNSPLLVMVIGFYVIKLLSTNLLGTYAVSHFLQSVTVLPFDLLIEGNPLVAFANVGTVNLVIYFALGVLGLLASLRLSRSVD
ncbi:hypothetical protein OPW36_17225 [Vibrio europaeus]|uniref:ABC transporter n=1 Tax=Vibrio europaeus TaxID=300876 RepID=A0AAE7DZ62_9VIBR|nr:hypothetical protein [Vibrio europaeus]MDC5805459.1 hypothetical protein [Vibrio europaeus]MDC5811235.1 hypothetical protein [Vibrio europaeus]MDC5826466.1 hypothetical protein [Vibrio europaeus]MDC5831832.1 hypothetical protein [Vibrio europaeus]MDC5834787.1 hypothetical protein [Vibrio europaeus]